MKNGCLYFATHSDNVTTPCGEEEPVDTVLQAVGKLRFNCECKDLPILYC